MSDNFTTLEAFKLLDIRAGTIIRTELFTEARNPSFKVWVNLGAELGIRKSSARITGNYNARELEGRQVICIVNLPPKQIGPFMSEILILGFKDENGEIVLAVPQIAVPDGAYLH
ncbi:MAG: tRNA-binding protein [Cyclobacteriaceae bacterium]